MNTKRIFAITTVAVVAGLFLAHTGLAQTPGLEGDGSVSLTFDDNNNLGGGTKISNISQVFIFMINLMRWLGWVGVILGVFIAIFALIYKLISTPSEKASEAVQGAVTKAVIIVIAGILLLSVGFFISQIGKLLGLDLNATQVINQQ